MLRVENLIINCYDRLGPLKVTQNLKVVGEKLSAKNRASRITPLVYYGAPGLKDLFRATASAIKS